jgi:hypothetical protein
MRRSGELTRLAVLLCLLSSGSCTVQDRGSESSTLAASGIEPVHDPCSTALFCDDFEDGATGELPASPWKEEMYGSGARIAIDEQRAFSGRKSMHVFAPKGAPRRGYIAIHEEPVFPAAHRKMFGRIMIWLDAAPVALEGKPDVHWTLLQGEGRSAEDTYNSIYRLGAERQSGVGLKANFETTPPVRTDCRRHSARELPIAKWTCVEWHFDGEKNEMQYWLDGTELEDIHVTERANAPDSNCIHQDDLHGTWLAPPAFQSLYLGLERYDATQNDQNLWIDDVVVSESRIGCPIVP